MDNRNIFPKGSYVVLLSTCNGNPAVWRHSMPINHCYKLKNKSHQLNFMVELDMEGRTDNGWSNPTLERVDKLELRLATPEEIAEYERLGKPYDVTKANLVPQIKNNYPLY